MLKAVAKNYRVVQLILIGDYSNWPPTKGREAAFKQSIADIATSHGVETRYLDFASHRHDVNAETKTRVAKAVHQIKPDVAFYLWEHDNHHDHTVASQLSKIALRHGGRVLNEDRFKSPKTAYQYDNGPGHTIGFEPDTYVDISDYWDQANRWLGESMAVLQKKPYDPNSPSRSQEGKEILARYRGRACGVSHAEAVYTPRKRPVEIL